MLWLGYVYYLLGLLYFVVDFCGFTIVVVVFVLYLGYSFVCFDLFWFVVVDILYFGNIMSWIQFYALFCPAYNCVIIRICNCTLIYLSTTCFTCWSHHTLMTTLLSDVMSALCLLDAILSNILSNLSLLIMLLMLLLMSIFYCTYIFFFFYM